MAVPMTTPKLYTSMFSYWLMHLMHFMRIWHNVNADVVGKGPVSVCSGASASIKYPGTCGDAAVVDISSFSNHHPRKDDASEHPEHPPPNTLLDDEEAHSKTAWSYRETPEAYGPHNWVKIAPTCAGPNQSPIDIITANALEMGIESPIEISMDDPTGNNVIEGRLINNGKTIEFEVNNKSPPVMFSGEMTEGEGYLLKQLHLHFGCGIKTGSEHSIDGIRYSGEMHMVFKNMKYGHPEVAMRKRDGLVILAFFLQVRPDADPNSAFEKISDNIVYVQFPKQKAAIRGGLSITNLIPLLRHGLVNLKRYVYKGSLPTPPCYESVTWVVFHRPINIRSNKFAGSVLGDSRGLMCDNWRPANNVNDRNVFKYTKYTILTTKPMTTTTTRKKIAKIFANIFGIGKSAQTTPDTTGSLHTQPSFLANIFKRSTTTSTTPPPPTAPQLNMPESVINPNVFVDSLPPPPTLPPTTTTTTPVPASSHCIVPSQITVFLVFVINVFKWFLHL